MQEVRRSPWLGVIPLSIGLFMVLVDVSILNIALPSISKDFNAKASDVQWILNAYTITLVVLLVLAGKIGDMVERHRYFALGMALFTISSYLCAESWNIGSLIAFRALQAVGGAIISSNTLAIMVELFPPGQRGTVMGLNAIMIASAFSIGPILGGWLTTHLGWHWVFYINVPIGIVGVLLGLTLLPKMAPKVREPIDFLGLILLAIGLGSLTLGIINGQDWGWNSDKTLACFIIAFPYLFAFIVRELTTPYPLLDLSLFRIRNFTAGILGIVLIFLGLALSLFLLPFFLQGIKGLTAEKAGYWILAIPIMNTLVAPIAGRLSDKVNPKYTMCTGPIFFVAGLLYLSGIKENVTYWEMFPGLSMLGIGMGMIMSPAMNVIMSSVPPQKAGVANGVMRTMNSLAQAMGVAFGGVLVTGSMNDLIPGYGNQLPDPGRMMMLKILAVYGNPSFFYVVDAFMESLHRVFITATLLPILGLLVILFFLSGEEHLKKMNAGKMSGFKT